MTKFTILCNKASRMVHVLPHKDFEQELYEKAPKQYVGPDRGSNPTALGLTDRLVCTQSISNPGWNKLVNNTGVVG